jgi:chromodomain-helicase-DNA-binding protein 4
MGLGKTIQTIAFIASLKEKERVRGPFLIIGPLSTIPNWDREFRTWAPHLNVVTYTGLQPSRQIIKEYEFYDDDSKDKSDVKFDVLLTSYELVTKDSSVLKPINWEVRIY